MVPEPSSHREVEQQLLLLAAAARQRDLGSVVSAAQTRYQMQAPALFALRLTLSTAGSTTFMSSIAWNNAYASCGCDDRTARACSGDVCTRVCEGEKLQQGVSQGGRDARRR